MLGNVSLLGTPSANGEYVPGNSGGLFSVWNNGALTTTASCPLCGSATGLGVNNNGDAVGQAGGGVQVPHGGSMSTLPGGPGEAGGTANNGTTVGNAGTCGAVYWSGGNVFSLPNSGGLGSFAYAISPSGRYVGGENANGNGEEWDLFLMTKPHSLSGRSDRRRH